MIVINIEEIIYALQECHQMSLYQLQTTMVTIFRLVCFVWFGLFDLVSVVVGGFFVRVFLFLATVVVT